MFEEGLTSLVLGNSGVTALIGTRFTPVIVPPDVNVLTVGTCLTYTIIGGDSESCLRGEETQERRVQFDAYGASYGDTKAALIALRNFLNNFSGVLSDGTRVIRAARTVPIDHFEDDARVYRSLSEYLFQIVEAA